MRATRDLVPLLLLLSGVAPAQEKPADKPGDGGVPVEVVVVEGTGDLADGAKPELAKELAPWAEKLEKLELARFSYHGRKESKAAAKDAKHVFDLPQGYRLEATPSLAAEGKKVRLKLLVTRPDPKAPPPAEGAEPKREMVVETEVELLPGQPCMLRCVKAFPQGDLLLLVSGGKKQE